MTEPKKHHFLPQFYLEQFKINPQLGKYPQIWLIKKSAAPNPIKSAIKDTGCATDYHTLDFQDQEKDRKNIEMALSKLESKQAELVKEICQTYQISEEKKTHLAEFISTMMFRVPFFKEYIEKSLKGNLQTTFKMLMHKGVLPEPPDELKELFMKQGYDCRKFKVFNWILLKYMMDMALNSTNSSLLRKMKCNLFLAPNGSTFITSDTPVSIYHPYHESLKHYGVGLLFKKIEVTFPLSVKVLIKLTWDGKEEIIQTDEHQVAEFNRRTIIMAKKYIYTSEFSKYLKKQIANFHDIRAGYEIDDIWYGEGGLQVTRFIPVTE